VPFTPECGEAAGDHRCVVDRRRCRLGEPPFEPAGSHASRARRVLHCDEGCQFERVREVEPSEFASGDLRDDEVAAIERASQDDGRVLVVAQQAFPGPGGSPSLETAAGESVKRASSGFARGRFTSSSRLGLPES